MVLIVKVGSKERFLKKMHDRVIKMQNNFEEYNDFNSFIHRPTCRHTYKQIINSPILQN